MYQIQLDDGVQIPIMLQPILEADDALYWADRIRNGDLMPDCGANIVLAAERPDWLTKNLPKTNPPASTRPGAEYGVDV